MVWPMDDAREDPRCLFALGPEHLAAILAANIERLPVSVGAKGWLLIDHHGANQINCSVYPFRLSAMYCGTTKRGVKRQRQ
jgi:hypothetical protein